MAEFKLRSAIVTIYVGIIILSLTNVAFTQILRTKCPNNHWTKFKERCYLVVQYTHSWSSANDYCQKYGGKLVEPSGYVLTEEVTQQVRDALNVDIQFWTGYNTLPQFNAGSNPGNHIGYWSDGKQTGVEVGVWGHNEPNHATGNCAMVNMQDHKWYMTSCSSIMPAVCELNPCPAGERETFMCNGKCLGPGLKCNGKDDCGNNMDEQNCPEKHCTHHFTSESGELTVGAPAARTCTWSITTSALTRINVNIADLSTEANTDLLEIWDGGVSLSTSRLVASYSGVRSDRVAFTSSYNFVHLRYVSDASITGTGFHLSWSTAYECSYSRLDGYTFSNTQIATGEFELLASRQTMSRCEETCTNNARCYGFSYDVAERNCSYVSLLPVLQVKEGHTLYIRTCTPGTTVKASVPTMTTDLTATSSGQHLSTPLYPNNYVGNMELEYIISTHGNNVIMLEVLSIDLCCGDNIYVYDHNNDLLSTLTYSSTTKVILSSGSKVKVIFVLLTHWQCRGALIQYTQGCHVSLVGSGELSTPGYGTEASYPHLSQCIWSVLAPSTDRSVTIIFEEFDIHTSDAVLIQNSTDSESYTGTSLQGRSLTAISGLTITMTTSSMENARGFKASFSPGCPSLLSEAYTLSSTSFNYGDTVVITCVPGYYFTGDYSHVESVTMYCELGGTWNPMDIPRCKQAFCGVPALVSHGFIVESSGIMGGDYAIYSCNHGYTLEGHDSVTCLANHSWTPSPACMSQSCSNASLAFQNANVEVEIWNGDGLEHGSVAMLTCPTHQEIIGAQLIQCSHGAWDYETELPYCRDIACEVPIIDNGFLSQPWPYTMNQELTVRCAVGYNLVGDATIRCGITNNMPICQKMTCAIADLMSSSGHIIPSNNDTSTTMYYYDDEVNVTCSYSYVLVDVLSTDMTVTCLDTGNWSHFPTCQQMGCGVPYKVKGSVQTTINTGMCLDYECSFNFSCGPRYEMAGASQVSGDAVVRCGGVNDGLWDFGDLRCIGGQCPDPGYPASGRMINDSFVEGATVMFACNRAGYTPIEPGRTYSNGLTCQYVETLSEMRWIGQMPICVDTEPPVIKNCDGGSRTIVTTNLAQSLFPEPYAIDNNAIKLWEVYPVNFDPEQIISEAVAVYYRAVDFANNAADCSIQVTIPNSIECHNPDTTALTLNLQAGQTNRHYGNQSVSVKTGGITVKYNPEYIDGVADVSSLNTVYTITVSSYEDDTLIKPLDTCELQYRFTGPICADWTLEVPNGELDCFEGVSGVICDITCLDGYLFMDAPLDSTTRMTCNAIAGWDKQLPTCVAIMHDHVLYRAMFSYKYYIEDGVNDPTDCTLAYTPIIKAKLENFAVAMATKCNIGHSSNPLTLTLLEATISYTEAMKRLHVDFTFVMVLLDESVSNSLAIKDDCSKTVIKESLEQQTGIETIAELAEITTPSPLSCGSGTFDYLNSEPIFHNTCKGNRRYLFLNSEHVCLDCPLGYRTLIVTNTDLSVEYSCEACPAGTYGGMSTNGAECRPCPDNSNPGLTAQTSLLSCSIRGICDRGEYSTDGLSPCTPCPRSYYNAGYASRTCLQCPTDKVTLQTGAASSTECLSQSQVQLITNVTLLEASPCYDNKCINGGNCTYVRNYYYCTCPPGYTGDQCQLTFNACTSNPCENEQICDGADNELGFICQCNREPHYGVKEFNGTYCENDIHGCSTSYCNNNGTCHNTRGGHECVCPSNSGFSNDDEQCGTESDPCLIEPCMYGTCVEHGTFYKSCDCYPGFTGTFCDTDIDDCAADLCQNGANCMDGVNSFHCRCTTGYHGPYCQFVTACDTLCVGDADVSCHTCVMENTAMCSNIGDSYSCSCMEGYHGVSCELEISACNSFPCQHGGACQPDPGQGYNCTCPHPWTGPNCEGQIDFCPGEDQCDNGGVCYSTSSGYSCSCPSDYIGVNCSEHYDLCERANPCVGAYSNCSLDDTGGFYCSCESGYTGANCEISLASCVDVSCANGGTCSLVNEEATCMCAPGYTGSSCSVNIDDCVSAPCTAQQQCQDGVNTYTCLCQPGKRGQDCSKTVGLDFDYIIRPMTQCANTFGAPIFGDDTTDLTSFSIAFWVRFTKAILGNAVILNVFGFQKGSTMDMSNPDLHIVFDVEGVTAFVKEATSTRKKRQTEMLDYGTEVMDGFWHHIVLTRSTSPRELTLYVDNIYRNQVVFSDSQSIANRGFVVLGEVDALGTESSLNSGFHGRISQLFVVSDKFNDEQITRLFTRSEIPSNIIVHQERNLMLRYPVDYDSELAENTERCLPGDGTCPTLSETVIPVVLSCPDDVLAVTSRLEPPSWHDPDFSGTDITPAISNVQDGGAYLDWDVHGISYAVFDNDKNAALCTFRLYNREMVCEMPDEDDDEDSECVTDSTSGSVRCVPDCSSGQSISGQYPAYLTCSMYGMWDEALKYTSYNYPACSGTEEGTVGCNLDLTLTFSGDVCHTSSSLYTDYVSHVLENIEALNLDVNKELCADSCAHIFSSAFTCVGDHALQVTVDFGILSSQMTYNRQSVTPTELLRIAVGDQEVFDYVDANDETKYVATDVRTFDVRSVAECREGFMLSGDTCVQCGVGTHYESSSGVCVRCPVGYYRGDTTNPTSDCTACHSSLTTTSDGSTQASDCIAKCLPGEYYDTDDTENCQDCPIGFYQDQAGQFTCKPCPLNKTTEEDGQISSDSCVLITSVTTTTEPGGPTNVGASTEEDSIGVGVIVAIVLGSLLFLMIILLIVCFCCFKEILPCCRKKKQTVSPTEKPGYFSNKYGEPTMKHSNYNLNAMREKRGKSVDQIPFVVDTPTSEESGSIKADMSIHVPIFNEKLDGSVRRKQMYMQNGGNQSMITTARSARSSHDPLMTSSPRDLQDFTIQTEKAKKKRRKRKSRDRSHKRHSHRHPDDVLPPGDGMRDQLPKALAPIPQRLKSTPPSENILRPSSALEQPRAQVVPSQFEDFLPPSPQRLPHHDSARSPGHDSRPPGYTSRSKEERRSRSRNRSRKQDEEIYENQRTSHYTSGGGYYENDDNYNASINGPRIEVESDDDLR